MDVEALVEAILIKVIVVIVDSLLQEQTIEEMLASVEFSEEPEVGVMQTIKVVGHSLSRQEIPGACQRSHSLQIHGGGTGTCPRARHVGCSATTSSSTATGSEHVESRCSTRSRMGR